ncbi:uncharacterized protein [Maniola hyperantus]|uniref:uncharacterized protein n=1 Tax=Aphantopus hyperantus TaxID=2795564 RepID=UPI0037479040
MSEQKQLKQLIKKRAIIKGKLTNFSTYLKYLKQCEETDPIQIQIELQLRLEKLEALYDEFDSFQNEIEEISEAIEDECKERQTFKTLYYSLVSSGRALIASHRKLSMPSHDSMVATDAEDSSDINKRKVVKLPKIELPHFNGDYHHWLGFRDTFNSLIHSDESIDPISKFHYLRASLKGNAASTISGLDFCADNYQSAWKILCDRYDNKRLLENHHLNSLLKIDSLQKESSADLRNLVDAINKNLRALANLGHSVQHWDILIIHIMSCKLDSVTNREWETHRNKLKDSPTLDIFLKFISNRANVLETLDTTKQDTIKQDNIKHIVVNNKPKSLLASTSKTKSNSCPLCNQEHCLYKCESFRLLPVECRIQKALEFKVCMKCLRFGHSKNKCRFSNCKYCSKKHSTLLHSESITSPALTENVALSANNQSHDSSFTTSTVLLSTALLKVLDSNGQSHAARILLDNGSTTNFVTKDFCRKLNLNTVSAKYKVLNCF